MGRFTLPLLAGFMLAGSLLVDLGAPRPATAGDGPSPLASLDLSRGENLFPDPIDHKLRQVRDLHDRIILVHREACGARLRAGSGSALDTQLMAALDGHHRELCRQALATLIRSARDGSSRALRLLGLRLADLPVPDDAAAFAPLLDRLPPQLLDGLDGFRSSAASAVASLEDPAALAAYVEAAPADPDVFRRNPLWRRGAEAARRGLDGLLDRLEGLVSAEDLIRFFDRTTRAPLPPAVTDRTASAREALLRKLRGELLDEFDDRVAAGLTETTRGIVRVQGFIATTTSLNPPRLRHLLREAGDRPDETTLRLFVPMIRTMRDHARATTAPSSAGTEYLAKVARSLDSAAMLLELKARREPPAPDDGTWWRRVRHTVTGCDTEGMFRELPASL